MSPQAEVQFTKKMSNFYTKAPQHPRYPSESIVDFRNILQLRRVHGTRLGTLIVMTVGKSVANWNNWDLGKENYRILVCELVLDEYQIFFLKIAVQRVLLTCNKKYSSFYLFRMSFNIL